MTGSVGRPLRRVAPIGESEKKNEVPSGLVEPARSKKSNCMRGGATPIDNHDRSEKGVEGGEWTRIKTGGETFIRCPSRLGSRGGVKHGVEGVAGDRKGGNRDCGNGTKSGSSCTDDMRAASHGGNFRSGDLDVQVMKAVKNAGRSAHNRRKG